MSWLDNLAVSKDQEVLHKIECKNFKVAILRLGSEIKAVVHAIAAVEPPRGIEYTRKPTTWNEINDLDESYYSDPKFMQWVNTLKVIDIEDTNPIGPEEPNWEDLRFFIARHDNVYYLVDTSGYNYARYLIRLDEEFHFGNNAPHPIEKEESTVVEEDTLNVDLLDNGVVVDRTSQEVVDLRVVADRALEAGTNNWDFCSICDKFTPKKNLVLDKADGLVCLLCRRDYKKEMGVPYPSKTKVAESKSKFEIGDIIDFEGTYWLVINVGESYYNLGALFKYPYNDSDIDIQLVDASATKSSVEEVREFLEQTAGNSKELDRALDAFEIYKGKIWEKAPQE